MLLSLHFLFNVSFERGSLPREWKLAHIVPIPKKVGCRIPLHRPISLLSVTGKLLDRIAAERVTHHAERNQWFAPFQGGFRRGRSTTDQLLEFRERIAFAQRTGNVCVASFLDLSRAYDRTWRAGVIYKLIKLGLRGRLLAWIINFLQDRYAAVVLAGVKSRVLPYKFGLPQGSCLSPILFNVFLCDLFPSNFINDRRDVGVFADDIRLACYETSVATASRRLTRELDSVATFARRWRLAFDVGSNKCGSMTFAFSEQGVQETVSFGGSTLQPFTEYKHLGVVFDRTLTFKSHVKRVRQRAWAAFHKIRKYASRYWGPSTDTIVLMYKSFVQPVLEYACPVWSSAKDTVLRSLDPVHYASLRAATGAKSTTSREALDVYCGTWPLNMRREFLCSVALFRAMRLDATKHPLAASFNRWNDHAGDDRRSFFHFASSLVQAHRRQRKIQDGGMEFAEPIPDTYPPPWGPRVPLTPLLSREKAVADHVALFNAQKNHEIFVYTDGSCVENPGRAGIGVLVCTPTCSYIASERVGIASIFTTELCAIHRALLLLISSCDKDLCRRIRVNMCVDNVAALRTAKGVWSPHQNWALVQRIRSCVDAISNSGVPVRWHWTPAHEDIHGNEYADKLAKKAAFSLVPRKPVSLAANTPRTYPQPPIPVSVSRSLTKTSLFNQQRERWYRSFAAHIDQDHLTRIQLSTTFNPRFSMGNRYTQTVLAQLRFGHSDLRAHQARFDNLSPMCPCGTAQETSAHFLLYCPLFERQRHMLERKLESLLPPDKYISESLLLGSPRHSLPPDMYRKVVSILGQYLQKTRRFASS